MQVNLTNLQSEKHKGEVEISDIVFGQPYNESLVHQIITAYSARARAGTHAQKNRSAVSGGGKKPWRQKGTGNARAGTTRSPLWRKGGVIFAASPRDYGQKVNKKMYAGAIRSMLSQMIRDERIIVVDNVTLNQPKTSDLVKQLKSLTFKTLLIVVNAIDKNLELASRNLVDVNVCTVSEVNPISLISHEKTLITTSALKKLEELLG